MTTTLASAATTEFVTPETIDRVIAACAAVNPNHHLWLNNNGIWAVNIILVRRSDQQVKRLRTSARTRCPREARRHCDALLRRYASDPEYALPMRAHHTPKRGESTAGYRAIRPVGAVGRPKSEAALRSDQYPAAA